MAQQYQVDIVTKVVGASKIAQLDKALAQLSKNSTKVDTAARRAATSTNTLGTAAQTAGTKAKSSAAGFKSMGAAINAAAAKITIIIGAVQTFSQVMGAAFERQNAEKRLQNLTGSTAEYEAALLSAASVSQKFGISQTEATQALGDVYSRLSGVGFGLKEVTTIYEGFNTIARESGVSSEAASSAFLQLGQAMGSGVLQGDELRSILEQMPQLTQLIAQEMGISASQVKKFGSEGKITSDIIFAALQKAADGAGDLNGKLTPAQKQMNDFNVAIDKASVALGTALIPALTGLIEAITPVISAVGTLVQKLDELGVSKVFEFLMAPARAFGELVNGAAGETENLTEAAKDAVEPFSSLPTPAGKAAEKAGTLKANMDGVATSTGTAKANADGLAGAIGNADTAAANLNAKLQAQQTLAQAKNSAAEASLERQVGLAETFDQKIEATNKLYDQKLKTLQEQTKFEQQSLSNQLEQGKITQEVFNLQTETLKVNHQSAQAELEHAANSERTALAKQQQQEAAAKMNETMKQTAGHAKMVNQGIADGRFELQRSVDLAALKDTSQMLYYKRQADIIENHIKENDLQGEQLAIAEQLLNQARQQQVEAGKNIDGLILSKDMHNEIGQELDRNNTKIEQGVRGMMQMAGAASGVANELGRAADNAARLSGGGGGGSRKSVSTKNANGVSNMRHNGGLFVPSYLIQDYGDGRGNGVQISTEKFGNVSYEQYKYLAENPTHGLKHYEQHKKQQREEQKKIQYEIQHGPDSYEQSFSKTSARYRAMQKENPNVNVNYSGTTLSFNGGEYVKKGDVKGIVNTAVGSTLKTLRSSSSARLSSGLR